MGFRTHAFEAIGRTNEVTVLDDHALDAPFDLTCSRFRDDSAAESTGGAASRAGLVRSDGTVATAAGWPAHGHGRLRCMRVAA